MVKRSLVLVPSVLVLLAGGCADAGSTGPAAPAVTEAATAAAVPLGSYDLAATISSSDPAWGDLAGTRYTGVLNIEGQGPEGAVGTFATLEITRPDGSEDQVGPGAIRGYRDARGRLVLELSTSAFHLDLFPVETVTGLGGTFFTGGHISGPFTAVLRPE